MEREVRLVQGNEACAEGALAAGVGFFAGYPITPATEIAEIMSRRLPEEGGVYLQMEDEIASAAAVVGAACGGVKSMTATSGPGLSLMQEIISCAIMMEIPMVIAAVQRLGPGMGSATSPAQMEMMQVRWGSHGGIPSIIALAPWTVQETFSLTVRAFNLSERFRVPVFLLSDATLSHMREKVALPSRDELKLVDRRRPTGPFEEYECFRPDENGVPLMAAFGSGYRLHFNSSVHDFHGHRTPPSDLKAISSLIERLETKLTSHLDEIHQVEEMLLDDAEIAVYAFGTTARAAKQAVQMARDEGIKVGLLRPITIWPFCDKAVNEVAKQVKTIIVAEMNMGQMYYEVQRASAGQARIELLSRYDTQIITPQQVLEKIREAR